MAEPRMNQATKPKKIGQLAHQRLERGTAQEAGIVQPDPVVSHGTIGLGRTTGFQSPVPRVSLQILSVCVRGEYPHLHV